MTTEQEHPPRSRPERSTRADVVAGAVLVLLVVAGAIGLGLGGESAATTSVTAAAPIAPPSPTPAAIPAFVPAWQAHSPGTTAPVVAGNAVVTADGSTVAGHDATSGAQSWSYTRDLPLCAVGSGFGDLGASSAQVLALYENASGWCSELTALRADTGARAGARNPNLRPGTRLIDNGSVVAGTGATTIEVMRSDLVRTVEYGRVETPVQVGRQPRPECVHAATLLVPERLGVIERCPGEPADRLSVLRPDENSDGKPAVEYSVPLPATGATLVALTKDRAAVALPSPARLLVLDNAGNPITQVPIDVSAAGLAAAADSPGGVPAVSADDRYLSWWTGMSTLLLDPVDLTLVATVPDALGPAVAYGSATLVPVRKGLAVVTNGRNPVVRTIPVARPDPAAPVRATVLGAVLLEQRGPDLVALVPAT